MPLRLIVAYGLIVFLLLAAGGLIAWKAYHSERRTYRREQERRVRARDRFDKGLTDSTAP